MNNFCILAVTLSTLVLPSFSEAGWVRKSGQLFEIGADGRERLIVKLSDGRLMAQSGAELAPLQTETLKGIMPLYEANPTLYKDILSHPSNSVGQTQIPATITEPDYVLENGAVFEVVNGQRSQVLTTESGWLVTKDSLGDGYRSIHPTVLKKLLQEYYGKNPEKYKHIIYNRGNLRDLQHKSSRPISLTHDDSQARENRVLALKRAVPPPPVDPLEKETTVVLPTANERTEVIKDGLSFSKTRFTPKPGNALGAIRSFNPETKKPERLYREVPEWAEKNARVYFKIEKEGAKNSRSRNAEALPKEYAALVKNLEEAEVRAAAAVEVPAPGFIGDIEFANLLSAADALHRYWARRLSALGGINALSAEEQAMYHADLKAFEQHVVGIRLAKIELSSSGNSDAIGEAAIREVVSEFQKDPITAKATMTRIQELAKVRGGEEDSLKYPKLNGLLLKMAGEGVSRIKVQPAIFERLKKQVESTHK